MRTAIATKFVAWEVPSLERPARLQGVRTSYQTQQRRKIEPRGKGLAYTQREQQFLFQERSTLARLEV